jgi:hypothetical protein
MRPDVHAVMAPEGQSASIICSWDCGLSGVRARRIVFARSFAAMI